MRVGCAAPSIVSDAPHVYPNRFTGASYVDDNLFIVDGKSHLIVLNKSKHFIFPDYLNMYPPSFCI